MRRPRLREVELGAVGVERPAVIGDRGAVGLMESNEGHTIVRRCRVRTKVMSYRSFRAHIRTRVKRWQSASLKKDWASFQLASHSSAALLCKAEQR